MDCEFGRGCRFCQYGRSLGFLVRGLRQQQEMTLRDLASAVGADFTYISKIENDRLDKPPSEALLSRIAMVLRCQPEVLIVRSGRIPKDVLEFLKVNESAIASIRELLMPPQRAQGQEG